MADLAADEPAQEVLGGARRNDSRFRGALVEESSCTGEEGLVDDRFVLGVVDLGAVGDLADVDRVADHSQDGLVGPQPAASVALAGVVQPVGERGGAEALVCVRGEDGSHECGLVGLGDEGLGRGVEPVAEGPGAGEPLAACRLALEALGDPVDEKTALELREDAEELEQHAPDRPVGVDRLGRRAQRHAGRVELFDDGHETDDRAADAVDAVDEEHVELAGSRRRERGLEAGALEGGARCLVDEAVGDLLAGLGGDEGFEALGLGFERVGLVDLVG
ncbi:MAG: hypothetical protein M0Z87_03150 [Actinomycetota bacterium]|nr:hypothetical protein [Actinomycetota bacterium]